LLVSGLPSRLVPKPIYGGGDSSQLHTTQAWAFACVDAGWLPLVSWEHCLGKGGIKEQLVDSPTPPPLFLDHKRPSQVTEKPIKK